MTEPQSIPSLQYDPTPFLYAKDTGHLNLLATFHYIGGGITLLFACIPLIHVTLGFLMISGKLSGTAGQAGPPPEIGWLFVIFGLLFVLLGWTMGILIIYSGRCIKHRRNWMFSLVIAGLMCLNVPIGTVLGVFTLVVLLRESVKQLYGFDPATTYSVPPPQ